MRQIERPWRAFAVGPDGTAAQMNAPEEWRRLMGVSPALSAGVDLLDDAGLGREENYRLLVVAERDGHNPEAFARHFVKLAKAARQPFV